MLLASPLWLLPAWIYFKVGTGRTISESLYQIFIILYGMEPVEDESSAARIVGGAVGILGTIVGGESTPTTLH